MYYLILLLIFILLVISLFFSYKEIKGRFIWLSIFITYASVLITYDISFIHLPLGIIVAYFIIKKWSKKNYSILKFTLSFSLIGFIFVHYINPPIEIKNFLETKNIHEQLNNFEKIDSIKVFSESEPIQNKIRMYINNDFDQEDTMLLTYILLDKGVKIKNQEWLNISAFNELGVQGTKIKYNNNGDTLCFEVNNTDYIGVFRKENNILYLRFVIKGVLTNEGKMLIKS